MRLIDADAEIAKINKEIEQYETRIIWLQNKKSEEPENNYNDWDEKIEQCERNILDCKKEIRRLRSYQTAYNPDKVVENLDEEKIKIMDNTGFRLEVIPANTAVALVKEGGINENS